MTTGTTMQIRKLSPHIGCEVTGVDLRRVDADAIARLNRAIEENVCMVVRDQTFTPAEFNDAMGRIFGVVMDQDHPRYSFPGLPGIKRYSNFNTDIAGNRMKTAEHWHTDGAYREQPPKFTILYALELPDTGGNTDVCNMRAAYQALPADLRRRLETMKTVNVRAASKTRTNVNANNEAIMAQGDQVPNLHPLVRTVDGIAEKGLWFDPARVEHIVGMNPEESQDFLYDLLDKTIRPEFTYSHRWRVGDVFLWDDRSSLHRANYDYDWNQHRLMYQATILGERPH
jgi:taurine dioxygenase